MPSRRRTPTCWPTRSSRAAVLIDTVYEHFQRDAALVDELGLRLLYTLETHVHADHVTAAWLFRQRQGSRIAVGARAGTTGHDLLLNDGDQVPFGARALTVRATPGHTGGCVSYVLDDASMAFTGDALLIRGAGRTDFQGGDPILLFASVHERIFSLPGPDAALSGARLRGPNLHQRRRGGCVQPAAGRTRSREDFVGFMSNLNLPPPTADRRRGARQPDLRPAQRGGAVADGHRSWAPVIAPTPACPRCR